MISLVSRLRLFAEEEFKNHKMALDQFYQLQVEKISANVRYYSERGVFHRSSEGGRCYARRLYTNMDRDGLLLADRMPDR